MAINFVLLLPAERVKEGGANVHLWNGGGSNPRHVATVIRYSLPPSGLAHVGSHGDRIVTDIVTSLSRYWENLEE